MCVFFIIGCGDPEDTTTPNGVQLINNGNKYDPPIPEPQPPIVEPDPDPPEPEVIGIGEIVIVVNADDHDLHVRDPAGLHLGENNIIGHMQNGIRGRVVGGPEHVSDLIWWEIRWLGGNCEITNRNPCIGWSAEFDVDGTQLLQLE